MVIDGIHPNKRLCPNEKKVTDLPNISVIGNIIGESNDHKNHWM